LKKKYLLLLILIAVAVGLLTTNIKPKQQHPNPPSQTSNMPKGTQDNKTAIQTQESSLTPTESVAKELSTANQPNTLIETTSTTEPPALPQNNLLPPVGEEMQSADIITDLWDNIAPDTIFSDFPPETDVKPVKAIRLSEADLIGTLKEGDLVRLPAIQGEEYTATITETKNFDNGTSSITGSYELNGDKHTVTLTQGIKTGFGTFSTPNGTYQISLFNGKGYIYSSDALDAKRIDTNKPDTLIPSEEE